MGCAALKETCKGFLGISTQAVEDARGEAITRTFGYDYNTTYTKVKAALKEISAYIYADNPKKKLIAVYVSETDTTPAGVFLKEIDATHTQIEVSSPSTSAKEAVAKDVFSVLEGTFKKEKMKGETDEKEMGIKSSY
jgi:hypothetical protein